MIDKPINLKQWQVKGVLDGSITKIIWPLKRPPKIRLHESVHSEIPIGPRLAATPGVYQAEVNQHGALSVWVGNELLGVKPGEFEWIYTYGPPGTVLWIRETYHRHQDGGITYRADEDPDSDVRGCFWRLQSDGVDHDYYIDKWRPATNMREEFSRPERLINKGVKVMDLQNVNEEDVLSYGIIKWEKGPLAPLFFESQEQCDGANLGYDRPIIAFEEKWNADHPRPYEKWEDNPMVGVMEIELLEVAT